MKGRKLLTQYLSDLGSESNNISHLCSFITCILPRSTFQREILYNAGCVYEGILEIVNSSNKLGRERQFRDLQPRFIICVGR
jgi:hypothetical membrane protein